MKLYSVGELNDVVWVSALVLQEVELLNCLQDAEGDHEVSPSLWIMCQFSISSRYFKEI